MYFIQSATNSHIGTLTWVFALSGSVWTRVEAFGLLLAILSAVLRSKLWRVALPAAFLTFLLTM